VLLHGSRQVRSWLIFDDRRKKSKMTTDERSTIIEHIAAAVSAGCSKEVFEAYRCPVCSSQLMLAVHPVKKLFFVRCDASSAHVSITREAAERPSWMEAFVRGGWL
jgi:hypothetical protein